MVSVHLKPLVWWESVTRECTVLTERINTVIVEITEDIDNEAARGGHPRGSNVDRCLLQLHSHS